MTISRNSAIYILTSIAILIIAWFSLQEQLDNVSMVDLRVNAFLFDRHAPEMAQKRPGIFALSILIGNYKIAHMLLCPALILGAYAAVYRILDDRQGTYVAVASLVVLLYFLVPYGATTFYSNIFYNGVAVSLVILAGTLKRGWLAVLLVILATSIHLKAVMLFFLVFYMPFRLGKMNGWLFLFFAVPLIFSVDTVNSYLTEGLTSLDIKAYYEAINFSAGVREDHLLRLKIIALGSVSILAALALPFQHIGLRDDVRFMLTYPSLVAIALALSGSIPFIERFVMPVIQVALLVALSATCSLGATVLARVRSEPLI